MKAKVLKFAPLPPTPPVTLRCMHLENGICWKCYNIIHEANDGSKTRKATPLLHR